MTKRAVIACISAIMMLPGAASIAGADTFTYELNGSYAESNGGPSLVPYGGTLAANGYYFGVNEGLSLSGTGAFDAYSIDIHFYFDNVSASFNGFQRILDFQNRTSDSGLYDSGGALQLYATGGSGDPQGITNNRQAFTNGTMADLVVTRNASGLFSASLPPAALWGAIPSFKLQKNKKISQNGSNSVAKTEIFLIFQSKTSI